MTPERYSEENATREIFFTEKELNGLIASETDLATRVAIDLSDDLASAKVLIPVDPDFPVLGGKTLRVNAGVELAYTAGRPIVVLRGISVMGVPVPNAWLGNLKNVDLVQQFGSDAGFWKAFADGVELIRVEDGELLIKLRE
jgi:plasmid maintenance system antidote protein VapI